MKPEPVEKDLRLNFFVSGDVLGALHGKSREFSRLGMARFCTSGDGGGNRELQREPAILPI